MKRLIQALLLATFTLLTNAGHAEEQSGDLINRLKAQAGGLIPDFGEANAILPPEEAFKLSVVRKDDAAIARFTVVKGHYLYRDKIKFRIEAPKDGKAGKPEFPKADLKDDPNFGRMHVYHHDFSVRVPLSGVTADQSVKLFVSWQGCNEAAGICYPPIDATFTLKAGAKVAPAVAEPVPAPEPVAEPTPIAPTSVTPAATAPLSESDRMTQLLESGNTAVVIGSFFIAGLLLSLTPCVFPMIPILSSIIVGQGTQVTRMRGFMLSLVYVLGMALTYAAAGVAAGMTGTLLSNALQTPWALGTGAAIFVLLAMSMFGFYELQLPSALQSRFTEVSNRMQGGHLLGVFGMGVLSALIVGPCVAAPLAGALIYIGQTGDVVLGGLSLFTMALGMGMPLLLIGLSAGALLPKAGSWMEGVKRFFGVLLIAVAIWLVSPLLPDWLVMLAWALLLILYGVYLRAIDSLGPNAHGMHRLSKGIGLVFLIYGAVLLIGLLAGGRNPLQPLGDMANCTLAGECGPANAAPATLQFTRVTSIADLEAKLKANAGRPAMLDFYADRCVSCKEMEHNTFTDAKVRARLAGVTLLQADVTANSADDRALLKRFGLFGSPGILFFDGQGRELNAKVIGYEPPAQFLQSLEQGLNAAPKERP